MSTNFTISSAVENILVELEVQRKKIVSSKMQGWSSIILGVICFGIGCVLSQVILAIVGFVIVIPGAIILFRISDDVAQYKSRFKQEVVGAALSSVDKTLTLDPNRGILESEFRSSQLFTTSPDRYSTEDLIRGTIGKTSFYFAEVHAEYKTEVQTKSGRQVTWHDILKGIVFTADFNKNFNGVTVVRPKDFGSKIGAWFSKNVYSFGDKNVVELENEDFSKNFVTYSNDQIEARYILTPAMMEKINDLNQRSANAISLSFIDTRMYIAFPLDKNYFEPPVFKTLLKPDLLDDDMSVLAFMYDIVRELDLNTRIWTKQ
ncbi:DUF3137 domain-containing protein [Pedobacter sp. LMG 31464]|uniref:DUF3137 domain-containing protein n=1 Tax=Pedobacter planticolens TaxID=2679964 RepID=A0A923E0D9_9SPHI|nr:DUF3137 domain-containing protein [Pedobacter planticolens]MBB2146411.1 DUF3137 domain-containing protein [Pedobacter planticolens]